MIRTVMQLPHPFHLLIIDDNSRDGTAQIVKGLLGEYPDRYLLKKEAGN